MNEREPLVPASRHPYIMVTDNDSHWYVIPKSEEPTWNRWLASAGYGYSDTPAYAEAVGGAPSLVSFTTYTIG